MCAAVSSGKGCDELSGSENWDELLVGDIILGHRKVVDVGNQRSLTPNPKIVGREGLARRNPADPPAPPGGRRHWPDMRATAERRRPAGRSGAGPRAGAQAAA
jgi:hypothetical protein